MEKDSFRNMCVAALAVALAECAPRTGNVRVPAESYVDRQSHALVTQEVATHAPAPSTVASAPRDVTLDDVVALVRERDLGVASARLETQALAAEMRQALARPNPHLEMTAENIGGSGSFGGIDQSESTLLLAQRLELGGKRRRRGAVAASALAGEAERVRLRESAAVAAAGEAFFELLGAQASYALAEETAARAAEVVREIERRRTAGAASAADVERARLFTTRAASEASQRDAQIMLARQRLAASWGEDGSAVGRARGTLDPLPALPQLAALESRIAASPPMATARAQAARARAELELERAGAVPDVTLGGGVRYLEGPGDVAFVLETAMELPFFDRRSGAISAAELRAARAEREHEAARLSTRDAVMRGYLQMRVAAEQVRLLETRHLPIARDAVAQSQRGYGDGTATSFDLFDAQRALLELRLQRIDALVDYHRAAMAVEGVLAPQVVR
ncbi:MAG TPA: TolC family protein [Candidatus Binatia bacterium]|nr:TolC family protein [Candidatus Binatia bacterium]